jgi:CheY-like chemotaxis protein
MAILDLSTPGADGLDVANELRSLRPETVVLYSSAITEKQLSNRVAFMLGETAQRPGERPADQTANTAVPIARGDFGHHSIRAFCAARPGAAVRGLGEGRASSRR